MASNCCGGGGGGGNNIIVFQLIECCKCSCSSQNKKMMMMMMKMNYTHINTNTVIIFYYAGRRRQGMLCIIAFYVLYILGIKVLFIQWTAIKNEILNLSLNNRKKKRFHFISLLN